MSEVNFWRAVKKLHKMVGKNPPAYVVDPSKAPIQYSTESCLHFVGFRGDEYVRAVRIFGPPDFIHRDNDQRLLRGGELGEGDMVIYANGSELKFNRYSFDDSAVM